MEERAVIGDEPDDIADLVFGMALRQIDDQMIGTRAYDLDLRIDGSKPVHRNVLPADTEYRAFHNAAVGILKILAEGIGTGLSDRLRRLCLELDNLCLEHEAIGIKERFRLARGGVVAEHEAFSEAEMIYALRHVLIDEHTHRGGIAAGYDGDLGIELTAGRTS